MDDRDNTIEEPKETQTTPAEPVQDNTPKVLSKSGNKNVLIIVAVVILAALVFAGYSYTTKKFLFTKSGTIDGVKYKSDGKETTLSGEEGNLTVGDDVKLPKDFPSNIPVHPKGKITLVSSKSPEATWIALEVKDSLSNVKNWYKTESVKKGWKIWAEDDAMLTLTGEKVGASVIFSEDNGVTLVSLTTMKLEDIKNLTGVDTNKTSEEELQNSILNQTD